jgi:hypothetical protein
LIQLMKRTLAVAVTAGAMLGLTGTGAAGAAALPKATLRVVPGWTYQGSGKLAVITACSQRGDVPVVGSKMLSKPVTLDKGHNLEIKVTGKTRPGKYTINLFCTRKSGERQLIDSATMQRVRILKVLGGFWQPDMPGLPKHFKPDVTVSSGPPPPAKKPHGTKGR